MFLFGTKIERIKAYAVHYGPHLTFLFAGSMINQTPQFSFHVIRSPRNQQIAPTNDREFRSAITHELRTPLTSILGFAEALLDDPFLKETTKAELSHILKSQHERLNRVVNELTQIVSFQHEELRSLVTGGDVLSVITAVAKFAAHRFPERSIQVSYVIQPKVIPEKIDAVELFSALVYLISLSAHATLDNKTITLRLLAASDLCTVYVHCGSEENPIDAAQPLHQHLGIIIARGIVERQGWALTAVNTENNGYAFILRCPLKAQSSISSTL